MNRFAKTLFGASLGAVTTFLTVGGFSPASAGDRVTYAVALDTIGQEVVTDSTCITSSRTLDEMGITAAEGVSQEAIWAVSSVIDCWTTNQVSGVPTDLEHYETRIRILGAYEIRVGETIRVFASVHWTDNTGKEEGTRIYEFQLVPAGGRYSIEFFHYDDPSETLRILADEGWEVTDLRDLFLSLRPFGDNELGGLQKIGDPSLRAAVEAIYATDEQALPGEEITDVIYVTFASQRGIFKAQGPVGPWVLAVDLQHGLLNFTYVSEDTPVDRLAVDLNVSHAEAREVLAAAGF